MDIGLVIPDQPASPNEGQMKPGDAPFFQRASAEPRQFGDFIRIQVF